LREKNPKFPDTPCLPKLRKNLKFGKSMTFLDPKVGEGRGGMESLWEIFFIFFPTNLGTYYLVQKQEENI